MNENCLREYVETRMKMYIDMVDHKTYTWEEERKLYDNIMELIACMDYCYITLTLKGLQTLTDIKNKHAIINNANELNLI